MYVVRNSSRALFAALIPLAVVHAVLLTMAVLTTQTVPAQAVLPPPDKLLFLYAGRLALDGVLLFAGHSENFSYVTRAFQLRGQTIYELAPDAARAGRP